MISNFQYYFMDLKTILKLINERIALFYIYFISYTYRMCVFKQRC
ncbi:109R [Invertebrate iridescent virus 6]|uniref:109R n=1 Tax=Invertebrate iridescent virus 6 TaxID=176652 RepID=Q91G14_IIV6|nr:109R [Invertebrate iridescent virus 6]AAK82018.1 109R [Invertebrate iridescent virus 6]